MLHGPLFSRILDRVDYLITSARLRVLDWICGPEPPTAADRQRERDRDRLRKAFPKIDFDCEHRG
jgi:hypothetical protein